MNAALSAVPSLLGTPLPAADDLRAFAYGEFNAMPERSKHA
jgi:hypothetical protein